MLPFLIKICISFYFHSRSLRISARRDVVLPEAPGGQLLAHALSIIEKMTGVTVDPADISSYNQMKNTYTLTWVLSIFYFMIYHSIIYRFFTAGKDTPMGRILQARKRPFIAENGQHLNIGLDAIQTRRNHNIFRHAFYQVMILIYYTNTFTILSRSS